jgi:uncharacterized damage-inducible protein DinB
MAGNILEKLFEHNNWANLQIIRVCSTLSDEQLDAEPKSATLGSIRSTLYHLVTSQQGYLRLLTLPLEERLEPVPDPPFAQLLEHATSSGGQLQALAGEELSLRVKGQIRTRNGYLAEPWVVMIQVINHATEHREQIKSMLSELGVTPPDIDGWDYGLITNALVPIEKVN